MKANNTSKSKEQQTIDQNVQSWKKEQDERKRREEYRNFHQCFNTVIPRHLHIPEQVLVHGKHHETKKLLPASTVHGPGTCPNDKRVDASHTSRQTVRDGVRLSLH